MRESAGVCPGHQSACPQAERSCYDKDRIESSDSGVVADVTNVPGKEFAILSMYVRAITIALPHEQEIRRSALLSVSELADRIELGCRSRTPLPVECLSPYISISLQNVL